MAGAAVIADHRLQQVGHDVGHLWFEHLLPFGLMGLEQAPRSGPAPAVPGGAAPVFPRSSKVA